MKHIILIALASFAANTFATEPGIDPELKKCERMAVRAVKSFVKKEYDTTPKITKVTFVADSGAVDETSFELLVDLGGESLGRFIHYQADLPSVRGVCVRRATITITEIPNAETEPNNSTESQEAK